MKTVRKFQLKIDQPLLKKDFLLLHPSSTFWMTVQSGKNGQAGFQHVSTNLENAIDKIPSSFLQKDKHQRAS